MIVLVIVINFQSCIYMDSKQYYPLCSVEYREARDWFPRKT